MSAGDSNDMLARIKRVVPPRWFAYVAPLRDAVLGGLSDQLAWVYAFIAYAQTQTRIITATGFWLDLICADYLGLTMRRRAGELDAAFMPRIKREIFRARVTRAGMAQTLLDLTGKAPIVFEPWNTGDTGAWDMAMGWQGNTAAQGGGGGFDVGCGWDASAEFDQPTASGATFFAGAGGWGDTCLPNQVFITAHRPGLQGIPNVSGMDCAAAGFDAGPIEWVDNSMIVGAVTDADIYAAINATKPTGSLCWTALQ